ncbi:MAG: ketol-acid reductoisomerase [Candidatus Diapherotrites archaeon]|uniref:Ketol-acid reductoisomerase n=1 Tax=Candidatus Iainarchaeum sp. TaxID=3101447 RepID=A0A8T4L839_9ARCH|nr:ketol-acid reductoisomerase [Candidatus Diapherotrites archaeon]
MKVLKGRKPSLKPLKGKTIAVIGFGPQGRVQAELLKRQGFKVIVGLRRGKSWKEAEKARHQVMTITAATLAADLLLVLVADTAHREVLDKHIVPFLRPGQTVVFAQGYSVAFNEVHLPWFVDVILLAPGVPAKEMLVPTGKALSARASVGIGNNFSGKASQTAKALCEALGFPRRNLLWSSFREEGITDLFSEQGPIVGGLIELMKASFETLVNAGYSPEVAYSCCVLEPYYVARLVHEQGIHGMLSRVSETAKYGALTVGPKIIGREVRREMRKALKRIESGEFMGELQRNRFKLPELLDREARSEIEKTRRKLVSGKA